MANPIRINAATLNRPGVFVTQATTGALPAPIATHAVAYMFGTTPTEEYYGEDALEAYSALEPYKPTQIGSVQDFLSKVGGEIPVGNKGALASYDGVGAFFENVGVNGILYFTRVTPTPETVIDLNGSGAGVGYNAFAIKVNGRYFGTSIGVLDADGDDIRVITTTALDEKDNARDLFEFLSSTPNEFSDYYKVEQTPEEALNARFRIFSKDSRSLPEVDRFFAYQFSDITFASATDLNVPTVVKFFTSVKELHFKCVSRDVDSNEPVFYISGSALSKFVETVNLATPGTYDPTTDQSDILKAFLVDQGVYTGVQSIPDDKLFAVSRDIGSGVGVGDAWPDTSAAYWRFNLGVDANTSAFAILVSGPNQVVPSGEIANLGGSITRSGVLPDTVQVFYVNIAGEDRAFIVNGATPDELNEALAEQIRAVFVEKELDSFYIVEAVPTGTNVTGNTYVPNNGYQTALNVADAGRPYIRPELSDIALQGTVTITNGAVTGVGTAFTTQLGEGDIIVSNGVRYTIATITSATAATVLPAIDQPAGSTITLDRSLPNGFYSYDYVLKVKITSKNGVSSPVNTGRNRFGEADSNVVRLVSTTQNAGYEGYKLTQSAKANDFVYAIEQALSPGNLAPGFLLAPEAYTVLSYDADGGPTNDLASKSEARRERLKITQTLTRAAQGSLGVTEGVTGTQHVALIDCGADEDSLNEVRDELLLIRSTVGVPFGHAAFYAPFVKNLSDRYVAPSSYQAGIACSRYINEGFQQPPAGARYPLRGAIGLKFAISAQQQEVTYALGLNPVRSLPNRGIVLWGSRTLSSNPLFKFVNTRVILNVFIDVLSRSFDDILFEQIDSAGTVYSRVKSIASQVCNQFFRQGAFFGSRPEQAYLVVCSSANNDDASLENGTVRLDAYVATSPTFERLLVTVVRTPLGQVAELSDSFSRNEERFTALLNNTTVIR